MQDHIKFLEQHHACATAMEFILSAPDRETAWNTCNRSDWMIWFLRSIRFSDQKVWRLFACWCVRNTPTNDGRTTWDLLSDPRNRDAVEVAERFANGEASAKELNVARNAAADAAADAAAAAAYSAAAYSAAAYSAADAAADAAYSAAAAADAAAAYSAAAAADAAAAAADAAAAHKAQADQLRLMVPFTTVQAILDQIQE